jgi:hypothetical protein
LAYFSLGAAAYITLAIYFAVVGRAVYGFFRPGYVNYTYGADEYDTVINGISPNGELAITSHGGGELGYDDFHLDLTDVATGRNISDPQGGRSAPRYQRDAFAAKWSSDSKQVTVVYRVDRHEPLKAVSYRITGEHLRLDKGPLDVKSEALMKYWQKYGAGSLKSPKVFGKRVKQYWQK